MSCKGRYHDLPSEEVKYVRSCNINLWHKAIENSKLEKKSVIASRCYMPNNKTWVYYLKYNQGFKAMITQKIYNFIINKNYTFFNNFIKKIFDSRFIGYTYLINENLADINDIMLVKYLETIFDKTCIKK